MKTQEEIRERAIEEAILFMFEQTYPEEQLSEVSKWLYEYFCQCVKDGVTNFNKHAENSGLDYRICDEFERCTMDELVHMINFIITRHIKSMGWVDTDDYENKICKNCESWDNHHSKMRLGGCMSGHIIYDYDCCGSFAGPEENRDADAFYGDYNDYCAKFKCGPKFGCVHFKNKDVK